MLMTRPKSESADERRFRLVVEGAPNAMVTIDRAGKIVMVNTQAERVFGYSRAELVGQPVEMLMPERFRSHHPGLREAFFTDPQPRLMGAGRDLYGLKKDGSEFPVEIGLNPIETDEGTMVVSAAIDITERKAAEVALRESERSLRLVVEATPNAMVMIDRAGKIVMVNSQAERAFGYSRAELVGQPVEMLVPERFRSHHSGLREAFFTDPQPRMMGAGRDLYGLKKDGSEFPVEIGLNPIETDEGTMVLAAIVDITERKAAELALRESEQRYSMLVDGVTDYAIYMLDPNGIVTSWNRGAQRMKGYRTEEIVGQHFSCFYTEEDRAANLPQQALEIAARDSRYEVEAWRVRKDGSRFWADAVIDALKNDSGQLIGFAKITRDITERVDAARELEEARIGLVQSRAEEALRRAQAELAHVARVTTLGELTASIAHEVNQPLTALVSSSNAGLNWLASQPPNIEKARQSLDRIIKEGKRAVEVIQRVRALANKADTQKSPLDINSVINETIALVELELVKYRVSLRMELAPALPTVLADRVQLQQVIINLVMNSIEAMQPVTDRPRELWIRTHRNEAHQVLVTVEDRGVGISAENADRLFDAFFTTKSSGMGMGLSICRSIIEQHGGRMSVTNNAGPGATLQFSLPLRQEDRS
jgi:PAS domain S-box-containing protein